MTDNTLQKKSNSEVSKNFRVIVEDIEKSLQQLADGENIIAGTKDNPIVNNSSKLPIEHFFTDGVYTRKMIMYKDMTVIGAIHKHLHICFLTEGHVVVADESGVNEYIAPCHIISTPGVKRVLYAIEDSVWYNIHKNIDDIKDINTIEKNTVALSYQEYEEYIKNK